MQSIEVLSYILTLLHLSSDFLSNPTNHHRFTLERFQLKPKALEKLYKASPNSNQNPSCSNLAKISSICNILLQKTINLVGATSGSFHFATTLFANSKKIHFKAPNSSSQTTDNSVSHSFSCCFREREVKMNLDEERLMMVLIANNDWRDV